MTIPDPEQPDAEELKRRQSAKAKTEEKRPAITRWEDEGGALADGPSVPSTPPEPKAKPSST